jgi:Cu/Ag efflux protein CusF
MLRLSRGILILIAAICFVLFLAPVVAAQEPATAEKATPAKRAQDRISGTISMIDKEHSVVDVRKGTVIRKVDYTPDTKITTMNKPEGSLSDLKEGARVICIGKFDKQSTKLVASRIDIRK